MTSPDATPAAAQGVSLSRIARFTVVMYKPQYLAYGILWVLALEGCAAHLSGVEWRPGWATVARIGVAVIALLYLRMVDEQKDLDYDRVHNPERPLVTGAVSAADLRVAMGVIAVVAIGASAALSPGSSVAIAVVLAYGLGLWGVEAVFPPLRSAILGNLAITYPVQVLFTGYVVISAMDTGQVARDWRVVPAAVIFAGAFLQFEFARKLSRDPRPGQMYYSNRLGVGMGVTVSLCCVAVAVGVTLASLTPWAQSGVVAVAGWAPLVAALLPVGGAVAFRVRRSTDYPPEPAALFVLILYGILIWAALVVPG
ncbi:MAG: hypothetical protein QM662_08880 [Gordonia sp. (in: high G+C Gram-positive bacteria)]